MKPIHVLVIIKFVGFNCTVQCELYQTSVDSHQTTAQVVA